VDAAVGQRDRYVDEVRSCWPQQVRLVLPEVILHFKRSSGIW